MAFTFSGGLDLQKPSKAFNGSITAYLTPKQTVIDFSGDKTELFPEVAKVVHPFLTKGDRFEIIKADFNSLAAAAKTCAPFYDKYGV